MEMENHETNVKVVEIAPQVVEIVQIEGISSRAIEIKDTVIDIGTDDIDDTNDIDDSADNVDSINHGETSIPTEHKEKKFFILIVKIKSTEVTETETEMIPTESISEGIKLIDTYYENVTSAHDKTRDMIHDKTYPDGKYVVREGNKFITYEKITTIAPGTFYNGTNVQINKLAEFTFRLNETEQIKFVKFVCSNQPADAQNSEVTFIFDITLNEFKKVPEKYSDGYYVFLEGEDFVLYKKDAAVLKGWIYNSTEISYKKIDQSQIKETSEIYNPTIVITGTCATDGLRVTTYQKDVPMIKEDIKLTLEQLSANQQVCIINKYEEIMKVESVDNEISGTNLNKLADTKSTEPIESTEPIDQTNETKTGETGETGEIGDQVDSLV
ncbi:MAG: hypothetical protein Terrestrivirus5_71 [Terrestrivirus sp.]|uniref:Uncharacterized protein n=1 Tax=Terrestrivirus sp. TaxID=2487775 RepID=A0A3G4ZS46_9VIRU|nr:MAG: hypothetical protein Terrestrivirus5_71 [Terrestrivirus sp.]